MPRGETFWNPYRWVEVSHDPPEHQEPLYHHRLDGLSGRIECTLTALTPLIVGDGCGNFVKHSKTGKPYIPATSLKGVIRSLAEIVGNAADPFPPEKSQVDKHHTSDRGVHIHGNSYSADVCARLFGFILQKAGRREDHQFAGLVQFSDAELTGDTNPNQWPQFSVAVGQPKPEHSSFYPDKWRRKVYHHIPNVDHLTGPHAGITQTTTNRPAPPGTRFAFTVDFRNIRDEELNLLIYCLALEEEVTVTLSKEALGPDAREGKTIRGPMRHKIGGCKPHGGGSAHIRIDNLRIRTDPADRYRGRDTARTFEGSRLKEELNRRTEGFKSRSDKTMQQLRAMMIYTSDDPRHPVYYPTYAWFQDDKLLPRNQKRSLKPTV